MSRRTYPLRNYPKTVTLSEAKGLACQKERFFAALRMTLCVSREFLIRRCIAFSIFLLLLTAPAITTAKTIYVDDDNPADFNNIQAAINNTNDGDTIIVAEGIYHENINFKGKNITLRSTNPNDPNVVAATIIDGMQNGSVVTLNSGEGPDCVLSGFTITYGNAARGGGVYCCSNPTIANCIFSNNSGEDGGGMYNHRSNPALTNCTFTGNSANYGGGMFNDDGSSPTVTNCTFTTNSAQSWGGGMLNDGYSSPTVTNCTFTGNSASGYGGGMVNFSGSPTVKGCTFSDNSANVGGGMGNIGCSPTVTNCTFRGNSAEYGYGGGMCNWERSSPTVTNCILWADVPSEICVYVYAGQQIVTYSDIQGGWPGEGIIDKDPCFADPNNGIII